DDLFEIARWLPTVMVAVNAPTFFPPVPVIVYVPSGISGPVTEAPNEARYWPWPLGVNDRELVPPVSMREAPASSPPLMEPDPNGKALGRSTHSPAGGNCALAIAAVAASLL